MCLEFPLYKDLRAAGPPWGLKGVYWNLLVEGGDGILANAEAAQDDGEEKTNGSFRRLEYFKPPRTYDVGKGTDMLSVWRVSKPR